MPFTGDDHNLPAGTIIPNGTASDAVTQHNAPFTDVSDALSELAVRVTGKQAASANLDEYAAVNPTAAGLALLDDADASAQRITLGLAIGTNVQAWSANLDEYSAVNPTAAGLALLDDGSADTQLITLGGGTEGIENFKANSITVTQTGTGAVARPYLAKLRDCVSLLDFYSGDDTRTADATAAINAALLAHRAVYIPPCKDAAFSDRWRFSGTISITQQGQCIFGDGFGSTVLEATTNNLPLITIASSLNGVTIEGITLTRSVTAIAGGNGIQSSTVTIGQSHIRNVLVEKQYNGFSLGPTDWSSLSHCITQKNIGAGVILVNTAADGVVQWSMDNVLAQKNGAQGFLVLSVAGPSQMTCGTIKNCASFANSASGLAFSGSVGVPIHGVRVDGGFFGEDGYSAVYLDTYGSQHTFTGVFTELTGTITTGPSLATAASNVGAGFEATANNTSVQFTGCHAQGNSQDGFFLAGGTHALGNCRVINNGVALGAGRRNGVYTIGTTKVVVSGGRYGSESGGTSQQYGVYAADGANTSIGFADMTGNATASWGAAANPNLLQSIGNLPNTLAVQLSGAGGVAVANPTGGFGAAGTINVATNVLKNNTAYTNP